MPIPSFMPSLHVAIQTNILSTLQRELISLRYLSEKHILVTVLKRVGYTLSYLSWLVGDCPKWNILGSSLCTLEEKTDCVYRLM